METTLAAAPKSPPTTRQFTLFTLIAATTAALASFGAAALSLEVWVMFAGFIAWFTRPATLRDSLHAMVCLWLGMALAPAAHHLTGALIPTLGSLALPFVVFLVGIVVVGLRTTPVVNNMLAWFLGLVTFFAAELPIVVAWTQLGGATAIGGFAGWVCHTLNHRIASA